MHPSRRQFLTLSAAAAVSLATPAVWAAGAANKLNSIGIQLYTVRGEMQNDLVKTLTTLAKIGYKEVEFAGYYGRSASEIKSLLADLGLTSVSTHFPLAELQPDVVQKTLDYAAEVGHKYVVLPWLNPEDRVSIDQYKSYAEILNKAGEKAKPMGIKMGYHNHAFEFDTVDGAIPYDVLLEQTDPELVEFTIDFYWVAKAGIDALALFDKYPGRFELCHVKDLGADGAIMDVGKGVIDFAKLFQQREKAGLKHFYVENDHPKDAFASAKTSFDYLDQLQF